MSHFYSNFYALNFSYTVSSDTFQDVPSPPSPSITDNEYRRSNDLVTEEENASDFPESFNISDEFIPAAENTDDSFQGESGVEEPQIVSESSERSFEGEIGGDHEDDFENQEQPEHDILQSENDPSERSDAGAIGGADEEEDVDDIQNLARQWMLCQIGNNCSNAVADNFFKFAIDNSNIFMRMKESGKQTSLNHLRRKVVHQDIPGITNDFRYHDLSLPEEERHENEILVANVSVQPMKRYPPDRYELIGQVTKIDVSTLKNLTSTYIFF